MSLGVASACVTAIKVAVRPCSSVNAVAFTNGDLEANRRPIFADTPHLLRGGATRRDPIGQGDFVGLFLRAINEHAFTRATP